MDDVLAVDDLTVVVRWRQPYPDAAVMADGWVVGFQPLPRHILLDPFRNLDPVAFLALPFWTVEYVGLGPSSSGSKNESEAATYVDSLRRTGVAVTQRVLPAALVGNPEQRAIQPGMQVRGASGVEYGTYTSEQISSPANRWQGDNRGGWSNPTYDRWFATFTTSLATADRIRSMAPMEKVFSEEVPVVFHYYGVEVNGHDVALRGPVARPAPNTSGAFLYVHTWEWRA